MTTKSMTVTVAARTKEDALVEASLHIADWDGTWDIPGEPVRTKIKHRSGAPLWQVTVEQQAESTDDESGLGQYRQRVTAEFDVMVFVGKGENAQTFNDVNADDLREACARWVEAQMTGLYAEPLVSAKRGPGDSRYVFPSEGALAMDRRPFWVPLTDLNVPTTDREEAAR
jgi:hypothetical protein